SAWAATNGSRRSVFDSSGLIAWSPRMTQPKAWSPTAATSYSSSPVVRAIHHDSTPKTTAMLARKVQNQAKPFASSSSTGSTISPREVNPVTATLMHTAANTAHINVAIFAEIFILISVYEVVPRVAIGPWSAIGFDAYRKSILDQTGDS